MTTAAGDLELGIPKLGTGSFFLSLLERRRRVDEALFAVVMEAYLHGVSTREASNKITDLVQALGADTGISKSEVSRIYADLDVEVGAFPHLISGRPRPPVRVPRRHLLHSKGEPPYGLPGRGDRHPSARTPVAITTAWETIRRFTLAVQ